MGNFPSIGYRNTGQRALHRSSQVLSGHALHTFAFEHFLRSGLFWPPVTNALLSLIQQRTLQGGIAEKTDGRISCKRSNYRLTAR